MKKYKVTVIMFGGDRRTQSIISAESENDAARLTLYDMSEDFELDSDDFSATIDISVQAL